LSGYRPQGLHDVCQFSTAFRINKLAIRKNSAIVIRSNVQLRLLQNFGPKRREAMAQ
jgi:hypothetical protein